MYVDRRSFVRTSLQAMSLLGLAPSVRADDPASPPATGTGPGPIRVGLWSEPLASQSVYSDGIDGALAPALEKAADVKLTRAHLDDSQAGLSDEFLDSLDALIWWGRYRHNEVPDDRAEAVAQRVRAGKLGFLALYASYCSKPFQLLMGDESCEPGGWREAGEPEIVSVRSPDHPIARGISAFTIPVSDMFSEPFGVPEPESVVFVSSWKQGETVRSGLTWTIGKGRVAYLRTGSEAYPVLFHPSIRQAVANAASWCAGRS